MTNQAKESSRLFTQGREKNFREKGDDRGMKSLGRNISMSDETKGRSRKLQELLWGLFFPQKTWQRFLAHRYLLTSTMTVNLCCHWRDFSRRIGNGHCHDLNMKVKMKPMKMKWKEFSKRQVHSRRLNRWRFPGSLVAITTQSKWIGTIRDLWNGSKTVQIIYRVISPKKIQGRGRKNMKIGNIWWFGPS